MRFRTAALMVFAIARRTQHRIITTVVVCTLVNIYLFIFAFLIRRVTNRENECARCEWYVLLNQVSGIVYSLWCRTLCVDINYRVIDCSWANHNNGNLIRWCCYVIVKVHHRHRLGIYITIIYQLLYNPWRKSLAIYVIALYFRRLINVLRRFFHNPKVNMLHALR